MPKNSSTHTSSPNPPEDVDVFLCYRRQGGTESAEWLYKVLNESTFESQNGKVFSTKVYYDQAAPGVGNWKKLHFPSLQIAKALIIICTTSIAKDFREKGLNDWVYEEIEWWVNNRVQPPIIIDTVGEGSRWLPDLITERWPDINRIDLLAEDLDFESEEDKDTFSTRIKNRIHDTILISKDKIEFNDLNKQKRNRRYLWVASIIAAIIGSVALYLFYNLHQTREAQRLEVEAQTTGNINDRLRLLKQSLDIRHTPQREAALYEVYSQGIFYTQSHQLNDITLAAISSNGKLVAATLKSENSNHPVELFEYIEGSLSSIGRAPRSSGNTIKKVEFGPGNHVLYIGGADRKIHAWDMQNRQIFKTYEVDNIVNDFSVAPGDSVVAISFDDYSGISILNLKKNNFVDTISLSSTIMDFAWLDHNRLAYTHLLPASENNPTTGLVVYEVDTRVSTIIDERQGYHTILKANSETLLVSKIGEVHKYKVNNEQYYQEREFKIIHEYNYNRDLQEQLISGLAYSTDSTFIISNRTIGGAHLWRGLDQASIAQVGERGRPLLACGFDRDNIITIDDEGLVRTWHLPYAHPEYYTQDRAKLGCLPDNDDHIRLIARSRQRHILKYTPPISDILVRSVFGQETIVALEANRDFIIAASESGSIKKISFDGRLLAEGRTSKNRPIRSIIISEPHDKIITLDQSNTIYHFDIESLDLTYDIQARSPTYDLSIDPKNGLILGACKDGLVRQWSLDHGQLIDSLQLGPIKKRLIECLPNETFVTVDDEDAIQLYKANGTLLSTYNAPARIGDLASDEYKGTVAFAVVNDLGQILVFDQNANLYQRLYSLTQNKAPTSISMNNGRIATAGSIPEIWKLSLPPDFNKVAL